jgi:magnesium chelatase family protein
MRVAEVHQFCKLDEAGDGLVCMVMSQLNLSARECHRMLTGACGVGADKLARTIADLVESDNIQSLHLVDALQYGPKLILG